MFWKRSERTISKKGSASPQLFSISPNIILLMSTPLDVEVWHVNKWLDHCYFKSKENPLKHLPAKVLMVGRSKSESACAMRHCCAGKAKKSWNVPEADAMDGKISSNKVRQMPLTKFGIPLTREPLFAMFVDVETIFRSGLATNVVCPNPIAFARYQRQQKPRVHVNVQQLHCQARSCQQQKEQQPESRRYVKPAKGRLNLCWWSFLLMLFHKRDLSRLFNEKFQTTYPGSWRDTWWNSKAKDNYKPEKQELLMTIP